MVTTTLAEYRKITKAMQMIPWNAQPDYNRIATEIGVTVHKVQGVWEGKITPPKKKRGPKASETRDLGHGAVAILTQKLSKVPRTACGKCDRKFDRLFTDGVCLECKITDWKRKQNDCN